jgi:hypothetical protein
MSETVLEPISNNKETVSDGSETFFSRDVGIAEAAKITGRSKGQIGRDSNSGRLSYTLNEKEQKRYKVSDLYALYGFRNPKEIQSQSDERPIDISLETAVKIAVLEAELKAKEETLRHREDEIRDLRQNRDRLIEQNQRLTLLLPAPKEHQEVVLPTPEPERKGFWQRLFS